MAKAEPILQFQVECHTKPGESVAITGSGPFGDWDVSCCLVLQPTKYPIWTGELVAPAASQAVEYKYVLVDTAGSLPKFLRWEHDGKNRRADLVPVAERQIFHNVFGRADENRVEIFLTSDVAAATPGRSAAQPPAAARGPAAGRAPPRLDMKATSADVLGVPATTEPRCKATQKQDFAAALPPALSRGSRRRTPPEIATVGVQGSPIGSRRSSFPSSHSQSSTNPESLLESLDVEPSVRFGRLICSPTAFAEKYELKPGSVLGTGMTGGVCVARARDTGAEVAVKTLRIGGPDEAEERKRLLAEVQNQLAMDHPNICRLLEVYEEPDQLRLVMECMKGPDLHEHLAAKGRYTERDAANCVRQMCSAVAYCHAHGVCHRDLKLENFCLEDNSENARVKMIDFGLSSASRVPLTNACGTLYYVAPEVLSQRYDKRCDMWSLGVLTYIFLGGRAPFMGRDDWNTVQLIKKAELKFPGQRWNHITPEAKSFIQSLLQVDVGARLDPEAALAHPWLWDEVASTPRPLDPQVLQGLRTFTNSNALKRAVLRAVTPVATAEKVAHWADQFEELDKDCSGSVAVQDLARSLAESGEIGELEAEELSEALAGADGAELIPYSAFLAACLSAHMTLGENQLREFFNRLDHNGDGTISAEDVSKALGDLIDPEDLEGDLAGTSLTYHDFRWLMTKPRLGPTILGLRQMIGAHSGVWSSWKVSGKIAKAKAQSMDQKETSEASRRENMAWRLWNRSLAKGEPMVDSSPDLGTRPEPTGFALALDNMLLALDLCGTSELERKSRAEKRELAIQYLARGHFGSTERLRALSDDDLVDTAAPCLTRPWGGSGDGRGKFLKILYKRTTTNELVRSVDELDMEERWLRATTEAKDGAVEPLRRENIYWRHWYMKKAEEQGRKQESSAARVAEAGA